MAAQSFLFHFLSRLRGHLQIYESLSFKYMSFWGNKKSMVSILLKKWFPQKFISFLSSFCSFSNLSSLLSSLSLLSFTITNSPLSKFINSWNMRVVFLNSIHLEVASFPFCLLINSSWLLVFILYLFFLLESIFNLYCWKGIHFS